ncbi:MAG: MT-A70 family methyltransferase [Alphaproteobacteria bacterium]
MTSLPLFGPRTEPCAVLVADPPWQPRDTLPGERGAAHKYQTMNVDELGALELHLPPRAERHVLLFWRLSSMVPEALAVLDAWGYLPASELVWVKLRPCRTCCATGRVERWRFGEQGLFVPAPPGARAAVSCPDCNGLGGTQHLGLGHYVRAAHEVAIIARPKKGRAPERLDLGVSSSFSAPMLLDVDGLLATSCTCGHEQDEHAPLGACFARDDTDKPAGCTCTGFTPRRGGIVHSAKPDAFYALIERLYPGPRTELFSRRARPGWQVATSDQPDRLDEVARVMRDVWPAREREERLAAARRRAAR